MKRVISTVLLIAALISITACGEGNSDKSSMSSSTAQESSVSGIELPADKFD